MSTKKQPRYCPNCLMVKGQARLLSQNSSANQGVVGAYICDTFGGCGSQFTEGFLDKSRGGEALMLAALGINTEDDPKVIAKGNVAERIEANRLTGERSVILPPDEESS